MKEQRNWTGYQQTKSKYVRIPPALIKTMKSSKRTDELENDRRFMIFFLLGLPFAYASMVFIVNSKGQMRIRAPI